MSSAPGSSAACAIDLVSDDEPDQVTTTRNRDEQVVPSHCTRTVTRAQTAARLQPVENGEQLLGSAVLTNTQFCDVDESSRWPVLQTSVPQKKHANEQTGIANRHSDPDNFTFGITSAPKGLLTNSFQDDTNREHQADRPPDHPLRSSASADLLGRAHHSETGAAVPLTISRPLDTYTSGFEAATFVPELRVPENSHDNAKKRANRTSPFHYTRSGLRYRASESLHTRSAGALHNRRTASLEKGKRASIRVPTKRSKVKNEPRKRRPQSDVTILTTHKSLEIWKQQAAKKFNIEAELHLTNVAAALYDKRNIQTVVPNRYFRRRRSNSSGEAFFKTRHSAAWSGSIVYQNINNCICHC